MGESRAHGTKAQLQISRCNGAHWEGNVKEEDFYPESSGKAWWGGEKQAGERCGQMSALESSLLMGIQEPPGTAGGRVGGLSQPLWMGICVFSVLFGLCIPMTL